MNQPRYASAAAAATPPRQCLRDIAALRVTGRLRMAHDPSTSAAPGIRAGRVFG